MFVQDRVQENIKAKSMSRVTTTLWRESTGYHKLWSYKYLTPTPRGGGHPNDGDGCDVSVRYYTL